MTGEVRLAIRNHSFLLLFSTIPAIPPRGRRGFRSHPCSSALYLAGRRAPDIEGASKKKCQEGPYNKPWHGKRWEWQAHIHSSFGNEKSRSTATVLRYKVVEAHTFASNKMGSQPASSIIVLYSFVQFCNNKNFFSPFYKCLCI